MNKLIEIIAQKKKSCLAPILHLLASPKIPKYLWAMYISCSNRDLIFPFLSDAPSKTRQVICKQSSTFKLPLAYKNYFVFKKLYNCFWRALFLFVDKVIGVETYHVLPVVLGPCLVLSLLSVYKFQMVTAWQVLLVSSDKKHIALFYCLHPMETRLKICAISAIWFLF